MKPRLETREILIWDSLDNVIEHKSIIHLIKAQKLRWLDHVEGIPDKRDVKEIYKWKLIAWRPIGRPKIRLMVNVMEGIEAMKTVNWKRWAEDRNKQMPIAEQELSRLSIWMNTTLGARLIWTTALN
jgi:hypothetical protein